MVEFRADKCVNQGFSGIFIVRSTCDIPPMILRSLADVM